MAKQGSTKEKILKLISKGDNNLSAISDRLDLAPSTVSKHLQDLEISGAIVQKDNPHVKKWKYYQLNSGATENKNERFGTNSNFIRAAAFAVLLAVFVGAAFIYLQSNPSKAVYIPVSLTDPPQVPSGTQALYINYSSLSVHLNHDGSSEWVPVNATGRLDLMGLINVSQVLGSAEIKPNSTVDMVRFNITSSSITLNNTTYPVQIMGKQVMAKVGSKQVNKSSDILLDFSPVVVPMYSRNSTSFVLLPSLKAAVVLNPELTRILPSFGSEHARYPAQQYNDLFRGADANLTVSNATLHSYANYTSLSMTLLNNGNSNVTVMAVLIYGNGTPSEMSNAIIVNGTAIVNESDIKNEQRGMPGIASSNGKMPMGSGFDAASRLFQHNGADFSINESAIREAGAYLGVNSVLIRMPGHSGDILIHDIGGSSGMRSPFDGTFVINNGMMPMRSSGIDFLVSGNGTLFIPSPRLMVTPIPKPGYLLMPKSSATLSYSGAIRIMEGGLSITLPNGSSYKVMIVTNKGIIRTNIISA